MKTISLSAVVTNRPQITLRHTVQRRSISTTVCSGIRRRSRALAGDMAPPFVRIVDVAEPGGLSPLPMDAVNSAITSCAPISLSLIRPMSFITSTHAPLRRSPRRGHHRSNQICVAAGESGKHSINTACHVHMRKTMTYLRHQ